jgi:hypothetical protein
VVTGVEVIAGGSLTGAGATLIVKLCVAVLPHAVADTVTIWVPAWVEVGVHLIRPELLMVMPAGAAVRA